MRETQKIAPRNASSLNMRSRWTSWVGLSVAGLVLVGCQKSETPLVSTPSGDPSAAATGSTGGSGGPSNLNPGTTDPGAAPGGGGEVPDEVKARTEAIERMATPTEREHVIQKPGEGKWEKTTAAADAITKFGKDLDSGLASLDPTLVEVSLEIEDRGAILKQLPVLKIQDKNRFRIEYGLPETQSAVNMLVADGVGKAMIENNVKKPVPAAGTSTKMSRAEVDTFIKRMPVEAFRFFGTGQKVWSPFVEGLRDPASGFKVTVDEMVASPVGEARPFYRLVANRAGKGKESTLVEVILDTKKNVPVTMRAQTTYADGKKRRMFWKAEWKFGGSFEAKDFIIPTIKEKSS